MNIAASSIMARMFDPSSFVCTGDRWTAKEGRKPSTDSKLENFMRKES